MFGIYYAVIFEFLQVKLVFTSKKPNLLINSYLSNLRHGKFHMHFAQLCYNNDPRSLIRIRETSAPLQGSRNEIIQRVHKWLDGHNDNELDELFTDGISGNQDNIKFRHRSEGQRKRFAKSKRGVLVINYKYISNNTEELGEERYATEQLRNRLKTARSRAGKTRILKELYKLRGSNHFISDDCHVDYKQRVTIGDNVLIQPNCCLYSYGGIELGDNVKISDHVTISSVDHPTGHNDLDKYAKVTIGNNVTIGSHAFIAPGIKIHDNCKICAGAVVTKSTTSDGQILRGNPAVPVNLSKANNKLGSKPATKFNITKAKHNGHWPAYCFY